VIAAALVVQGGPARLGRGEAGMLRAIEGGLHDDGGLVSRSPTEQLALVELMGQLRAAYYAARREIPDPLAEAGAGAVGALMAVTMSDGALSSWQGGNPGSSRRVAAALEGSGVDSRALRQARGWGYQRLAAKQRLLVMDAAPPPPSRALKGGCASTLAFEFSDGAHRLIVNCGGAGELVGALPGELARGLRDETGGTCLLEASHDGYVRRFGLLHQRQVTLSADGLQLEGEDRLIPTGRNRRAEPLPFTVRFHLAPGVEVTSTADGRGALLRIKGGAVWQFRCRGGQLAIDDSLWINEEARPLASQQLVVTGETPPEGITISWHLRRAS
jgi:uncharacterized heparinase superfamily protein